MQANFANDKRFYYNFLQRIKSEFPEEFRYARRLTSFKGPKKLCTTSVHLLESNHTWIGNLLEKPALQSPAFLVGF
jgi:hypothetical protein